MKNNPVRFSLKIAAPLFLILLTSCLTAIFAQDNPARGVISEDFNAPKVVKSISGQILQSRRKAVKTTTATVKSKNYLQRRKTQRISLNAKSKINVPAQKSNADNAQTTVKTAASNFGWEEIGFTVWKLRRKQPNETSASVSAVENGIRVEYVPERMESETPLQLGDKVRITVESPRDGYLYVVDTEQYTDKTFGKPYLIFPTGRTRGGNNRVSAGVLIDIPAQDDDVPFYVVNSKNPLYAGELLSIIITAEPLPEIQTPPQARILEQALTAQWRENWELEAEVFEQEGGSGASWTPAEKEAGQVGGRALTQEDPAPQTVYRVYADKRKPVLVDLALPVQRK
ncbi:MAG TPA: hypothetical protein VGB00_02605 [Pyrinomonadaceae bacterium]